MKPNLDRALPGRQPGRVVLVLVCAEAECNATVGKVLRNADGDMWMNKLAQPRAEYKRLRAMRGRRVAAPPVVAVSPVPSPTPLWCPTHGDRPAPDEGTILATIGDGDRPPRLAV
jgi:hypothetical protein